MIYPFLQLLMSLQVFAFLEKDPLLDSESIHYSIQDMILKFKNLTNVQDDNISLFESNSAFISNSCIKLAIRPILDECIKQNINEMNLQLRSKTAAKLSICEFQVAKIVYPEECQYDPENMEDCIVAMERRSQWWTSYSGYYRTIGEICYQERLPYEKESILEMFLEVTEHYGYVLEFLKEYSNVFDGFKDESSKSFLKMFEHLNEFNVKTDKNKVEFDEMWQLVRDKFQNMTQMSNEVADLVVKQNKEFEGNLMNLFNSVEFEYDYNLQMFREKFIKEVEIRENVMSEIIENTEHGLKQIQLMNFKNLEMNGRVYQGLEMNSKQLNDLNDTINGINETANELVRDMGVIQEIMNKLTDYFDRMAIILNNFRIEVVFLFISTTVIISVLLNLVCSPLLFRYVGLAVVSAVCGASVMICVIH